MGRALLDLDILADLEIDLAAITQRLEQEGLQQWTKSYDGLLAALNGKRLGAVAN